MSLICSLSLPVGSVRAPQSIPLRSRCRLARVRPEGFGIPLPACKPSFRRSCLGRTIRASVSSEDGSKLPQDVRIPPVPTATVVKSNVARSVLASIKRNLGLLWKPAAVVALACVFALQSPSPALAARTGGRVGGRSFSSSSRSYSRSGTTSSSSYSRSGSTSSSSLSRSSPSFSSSFGSYRYSPSLTSPNVGSGAAVLAPSAMYPTYPSVVVPIIGGFGGYGYGGGVFSTLAFLWLAYMLIGSLANLFGGGSRQEEEEDYYGGGYDESSTVMCLQVALLGMARSFQQDLDSIAERADTSSPEGLHLLLTETVLALLRNPDYCVRACSRFEKARDFDAAEAKFNAMSLEERGKIRNETLVNVDDRRARKRAPGASDAAVGGNEFIAVTILVSAEGRIRFPSVMDNASLREALKVLGSVPADSVQAVELLWTPQDPSDTLTERELLQDYPNLHPL
eukprot:jgi/Mesvir1/23199/Mv22663-RA.1